MTTNTALTQEAPTTGQGTNASGSAPETLFAAPATTAQAAGTDFPAEAPGQTAAPAAAQTATQGRGNAFAITSFVLGIASIVSGWTFFAPIVGIIFGVLALRRETGERTLALWGVWMNVAMLALTVLAFTAMAVFAVFALILGAPIFAV